jgi:hypothetical protein
VDVIYSAWHVATAQVIGAVAYVIPLVGPAAIVKLQPIINHSVLSDLNPENFVRVLPIIVAVAELDV